MLANPDVRGRLGPALIGPLAVIAALGWSAWPTLATLWDRWMTDPRYSHGMLVPLFAGYLLWQRRQLRPAASAGSLGLGLLLIGLGAAAQVGGARIYFAWLEGFALIPTLGGVAALWGGGRGLRWAAPALAFLIFMIPLPYRLEVALGGPLQRFGTIASTYALQTLGLPAIAEGNIIRLDDDASIAVVEACNGLGMLAAFTCYATAAAILMTDRDGITRGIILLSAVPLALIANITRIVATGVVHATFGGSAADLVFHDLAGWLMMPLALFLLWVELAVLSALIITRPDESMVASLRQSFAPVVRTGT